MENWHVTSLHAHDSLKLTCAQHNVVTSTKKVVSVIGPPGSGKTWTLAHVVKSLFDNNTNTIKLIFIVAKSNHTAEEAFIKTCQVFGDKFTCKRVRSGALTVHEIF